MFPIVEHHQRLGDYKHQSLVFRNIEGLDQASFYRANKQNNKNYFGLDAALGCIS
jgi:hypothetical protein